MTPEQAREELRRREKRAAFDPDKICHPKQARMVNSIIRRKRRNITALAGRQSGKSFGGVEAALAIASAVPRVNLIYVTSTYSTCEKMAFLPAVQMASDYCLDATPRYGNSPAIKFGNGSTIYFIGADSEKAIGRLRGTPNLIICFIDECGIYSDEMLTNMIRAVRPGLRPLAGSLVLMGTPPRGRTTGTFLDAVRNPEYEHHQFDYRDNDKIKSPEDGRTLTPDEVEALIDEDLRAEFPDLTPAQRRKTAFFLCEYLAIPTVEQAERVYQFGPANTYADAPDDLTNYIVFGQVGVAGHFDAIGVIGWAEDDDTVYLVDEYVQREQATDRIGDTLRSWWVTYDPIVVSMYAGKGEKSITALQNRFPDVPIEAAPYPDEFQQVKELNDFLVSGRLRALPGSEFAHGVVLPTWVGGVVNGKIDDTGGKRSDVVPCVRLGVLAARPCLPSPRLRESPAKRAARLAREERAARMAKVLRRSGPLSAENQFDDVPEMDDGWGDD